MSKPTPLSGFPEWLPEQRIIEQRFLDHIRRTFELYGFASLETRAVEPLDQLLRKGETSKEVYVLKRLQDQGDGDSGMGLHFDLTVPFARYVLENAGKLEFPFRRYQIQKVWRGERPQEGRFREFVQADIDAGRLVNPRIGSWRELNDREAILCTTGFPFRFDGTVKPLYIKLVRGDLDLAKMLEDTFAMSQLCWPVPNRCMRLPIDLKLCDDLLRATAIVVPSRTSGKVDALIGNRALVARIDGELELSGR